MKKFLLSTTNSKKNVSSSAILAVLAVGMTVLSIAPVANAGDAENIKDGVKQIVEKRKEFTDVAGQWAKVAIDRAVEKGYVDGYPDGAFKPDDRVKRAEFVKMVDSALQLNVPAESVNDSWYLPYINAAVNAGFHQWSDFSSGDWNSSLTRKEMARIAVRAATGENNYDDKKWMYLATKAGLITGLDDTGTLGEDNTTTRAQSVTIIERILSIKGGETLPSDKHAISRAEVSWHGTNIFTMLPRYFNNKQIDSFTLREAQWTSADGIYHEDVTDYIVVDMDDKDDPFKNEISGLPFPFRTYDSNGKPVIGKLIKYTSAPKNSYVTYSKVRQTVNGQYSKDVLVNIGGGIEMGNIIGPKEARNAHNTSWIGAYASVEGDGSVVSFTKPASDQPYIDWNVSKFDNPYFAEKISSGIYYWIRAQVHPKGDMYSSANVVTLNYLPNLRYMNTVGPKKNTSIISSVPNYNISNTN